MRTTMKKLIFASLYLSIALLAAGSVCAAPLYFPHVDTSLPWQTEIAIINASDQAVTGTLRALRNDGQLVESKAVALSAHGRRQITVADEFSNHTSIGYIVFETSSDALQGYTKFYQAGKYRAAIPAVKEVNTSDIYISHIDSSAQWWTGVSLVNTTSAAKDLTITFNNGLSVPYTVNANEHRAFTIGSLLNQPIQPDIQSAVITNASGVIGLELFGNTGGNDHLDGILLTDNTTSTIYYPHVDSNGWWTGIVANNPSVSACTITITPYSAEGAPLSPKTLPIEGKEKYVGVVADLGLPADTAWFRIDSTRPLSGFELFGTVNGNQLAAYAGGGGTGVKAGTFAKVEKSGWTGIAFVNTEADLATVLLIAYNDSGNMVATQALTVGAHAKVVNLAEAIFSRDISSATYIAYSSDRNVVGFQLNGSSDGMMLDGLPAFAATDTTGDSNQYALPGARTTFTFTEVLNNLKTPALVSEFMKNNIEYDTKWDAAAGGNEYVPAATVYERGSDDCDGQAILQCSILEHNGWAAYMIGLSIDTPVGHNICGVNMPNGTILILDNKGRIEGYFHSFSEIAAHYIAKGSMLNGGSLRTVSSSAIDRPLTQGSDVLSLPWVIHPY